MIHRVKVKSMNIINLVIQNKKLEEFWKNWKVYNDLRYMFNLSIVQTLAKINNYTGMVVHRYMYWDVYATIRS